jgi:hypothetical protein
MLKYKLDSMGIQEVKWDRDGTEAAGQCTFLYGNGTLNKKLVTGVFVHKRIT